MILSAYRIIGVMLVFIVLSGCFGGSSTSRSQNDDGRNVLGEVRFADTVLTLQSTVVIDNQSIETEDGTFMIRMIPGDYAYHVSTLLGAEAGRVWLDGIDPWVVTISAFSGWSAALFDVFVVQHSPQNAYNATIRWQSDQVIKTWIETPFDNVNIEQRHTDMAWDVMKEWQDDLYDAITFERTFDKEEADFVFRFDDEDRIAGYAGICNRRWMSDTGYMTHGEVVVAHSSPVILEEHGVYRHEVGHCIGLGHSTSEEHNMYPTIYIGHNVEVTEEEKNYARLLYSIQQSGPLGTHFGAAQPLKYGDAPRQTADGPGEMMMETIPLRVVGDF